jgi:hypothetical protein
MSLSSNLTFVELKMATKRPHSKKVKVPTVGAGSPRAKYYSTKTNGLEDSLTHHHLQV